MEDERHRRCIVVRGGPRETAKVAARTVERLPPSEVLWVSDGDVEKPQLPVAGRSVRKQLGRSFDAVVLDFHRGLDADLLGQCHGFVRGGGALILRMPERGEFPVERQDRFAAFPYGPTDVGYRFRAHLERVMERSIPDAAPHPVRPPSHDTNGTDEQAQLVERIVGLMTGEWPGRIVVTADRGRGKSSALGLAVRRLGSDARVAVSGPNRDAVLEVLRFAERDDIAFVEPTELLYADDEYEVVVIDEAARLSVPLLQRLTERHSSAKIAYATTTHGYEGTGRGFSLRFVEWLKRQPAPVEELMLAEPIRWGPGDPLERFVFDALLLDAEPAPIDASAGPGDVRHVCFDRDELVEDERLLREFFGLLIQAHYRTTPGDLHRLLDAPNLDLHALLHGGHVVAATLVADEGGLPDELTDEIFHGRRIRGHALPESLVCHLGHCEAGALEMRRSVRIAVHPDLRRCGLGSELVRRVHAAYAPDLFGTLFGATPGLLQFRRSVGYEVVRLSASRGARTGEPSVVMLRPRSEAANELVRELRREFARDLPLQLELMQAGRELDLDDPLVDALRVDLPEPADLSDEARREVVEAYAFGPRTLESAAYALRSFVEAHSWGLDELGADERALIEGRLLAAASWEQVMEETSHPSYPATMRAMRRAIRRFVDTVDAG